MTNLSSQLAELEPKAAEPATSGDEISLVDVFTQLALRKRMILLVTGVAVLIGLILAFALPVRYEAATRIMPPQQTQSSASMLMNQLSTSPAGSLASLAGGGGAALGLKNPNDIYVGLLKSRPIADAIIQRFNLRAEYHSKDMTAARKKLEGYTDIVSEKSGMICVTVSDKNKKRVAEIANAYVDEFRGLTKSLAVTEASHRRLFYEEQVNDAKESLIAAETAFQQVQQNKGLVALDAQAKVMIEGMAELRARAAAKQVELQALRSYSTDRNPEVEIAERELASIQGEISRLEQRNRTSRTPNDLGLEDVPSAGLDYLRAEHEVKYRQAMFDLLIRQYDAAKLDESKEAAIIQVVEPAIEPDRKASPKRALLVLCSLVAGLFIGCIVALIQWWIRCAQSDLKLSRQLQELKFALRH